MLFKIRIRLSSGSKFLEVWSCSIKVVAKLDSIRKKKAEQQGANLVPRKNKRARADDLLDSLSSIQQQQKHQADLLNSLIVRMAVPAPFVGTPTPVQPISTAPLSLEAAFNQFLEVLHQVDCEERPKKMRRICENLSEGNRKAVSEIGCVFSDFVPDSTEVQVELVEPLCQNSSEKVSPLSTSSDIDSFLVDSPLYEETTDFLPDDQGQAPCLYQRELENWNSVLHEFLMQDDDA